MAREGDLANLMPTLSLGDLIDSSKTGSQSEAAHKNFRAMLQPAFTPEAINGQFLPEVVSIVDGALRAWAAKGEAVPGYDAFKRMTFEIIIKVGAGGVGRRGPGVGGV
jgi:cytochrome P450